MNNCVGFLKNEHSLVLTSYRGSSLSIEMSPAWEITNESYRGGGELFINRDEYTTCLVASILDGGGTGFLHKESCISMMAKIISK